MISNFNELNEAENDSASLSSEGSHEPYYHTATGKIVPAREAWAVLASEGHPQYQTKSSSGNSAQKRKKREKQSNSTIFRSPSPKNNNMNDTPQQLSPESSSAATGEDSETEIHQVSSFSGPTQSTIDKALHPESPNHMSPNKDIKEAFRQSSLNHENNSMMMPPSLDDSDGETDPVVLRALAMAQSAQNGQKLTPEQMQLIAQPDIQQQKLIEEAKRVQKAKELQYQQQSVKHLQQIGADIKKFITEEKEKPAMQWGADLGKFIESQSMKKMSGTPGDGGGGDGQMSTSPDGGEDVSSSPTASSLSSSKKKMEGFGSDPSPIETPTSASNISKKIQWPNMPPLPLLNEGITKILPASLISNKFGGETDENVNVDTTQLPVTISGVLWKRRSGLGKHTIKAWERRRVEFRGSTLIYYQTAEEKEEEEKEPSPDTTHDENVSSGLSTPRGSERPNNDGPSEISPSTAGGVGASSSTTKKLNIFEQAAQAAEQHIQTTQEKLMGSLGLKNSADKPRGILDIIKENASVSASVGHSGAPTPFCLSIKVKLDARATKWKFCFDSHGMMMEWLSAMTDCIVKYSTDASGSTKGDVSAWEMENYCIKRGVNHEDIDERRVSDNMISPTTAEIDSVPSSAAASENQHWMISGTNLYIAWAMSNVALILARSSSTTISQYWKLVVFTNSAAWMLCTRPKISSLLQKRSSISSIKSKQPSNSKIIKSVKKGYKPVAGNTTFQVKSESDSNINKNGHELPSWIPIPSSEMDVRSHGYLTTKTKIPSPGELYECVAVDVLMSDNRYPEIAPRVKFDDKFKIDSASIREKTWKSPDIFVASLAIPLEAPRFGQASDDGVGMTIIGYFKIKNETREVLKRITAAGYDQSTDAADQNTDVQKRIVNAVRLWERYCKEAPNDPTFQARFKLIPAANLEELGCPSYISKYNGKPILIKRNQVTGFFTDYPKLNAMEFNISLHPFPYLFKQAMTYLQDYFDKSIWTFGFVVEGRNDDELPEVVIGAMKVVRPSPSYIVNGDEFFSGTSSTTALPHNAG